MKYSEARLRWTETNVLPIQEWLNATLSNNTKPVQAFQFRDIKKT
jgi:hypothetical protein